MVHDVFRVITDSEGWQWDWLPAQGPNLIVCHISQPGTGIPDIAMVTEAGIIGKIGLNSKGVGCCLNAIRCRGVDRSRMPIHFALRTVLESSSRDEAVAALKSVGLAGSGHVLIADPSGSVGLECTSKWVKELVAEHGRVHHTNHLLLEHGDVDEPGWLVDSPGRLARVRELTAQMLGEPAVESLFEIFKDEKGYPASINRQAGGMVTSTTLFTIIMDLGNRTALVTFGRPTEYQESTTLAF